jgi:hypothetical protein
MRARPPSGRSFDRASLALTGLLLVMGTTGCPKDIPAPVDASASDGPVDSAPDQRPPSPDRAVVDGPRPDAVPDAPGDAGGGTVLCGGDHQLCCPGNGCLNKGCCVGGRCVASGTTCLQNDQDILTCVLESTCGGCGGAPIDSATGTLLLDCCPGALCTAPRTVCLQSANKCISCGGAGLACCGDGFCEKDLSCRVGVGQDYPSGTCVKCGGPGQSCCPDQQCASGGCCAGGICAPNGAACAADGGLCANGLCASCGAAGKKCCGGRDDVGKACGQTDTVCTTPSGPGSGDATCVACGANDQACCANKRCKDPTRACVEGTCKPCGMPGQACCTGDLCNGGGCCINNACIASGSTCGSPIGNCASAVCQGCGDAGQPCCPTAASAMRSACHVNLKCSPDALCVKAN